MKKKTKRLKNRKDEEDGPVGNVLAMQTRGPEFHSPELKQQAGGLVHVEPQHSDGTGEPQSKLAALADPVNSGFK